MKKSIAVGLLLAVCSYSCAQRTDTATRAQSRPALLDVVEPPPIEDDPEPAYDDAFNTSQYPPLYEEIVGNLDRNLAFTDFLFENDGQVVALNVVVAPGFDDYRLGEDWLAIWTECEDERPKHEPASPSYCAGVSINAETDDESRELLTYTAAGYTLRGNWQVRANPGMHQGQLSITLIAVP